VVADRRPDTVEGLGVSAGIAEGIVRVVRDLDEADIDEGTVVCRATDPSWASLFPLAEAVVTDVGSAMSHAAIVCRELGLPCVAGTRNGTTTLRDGMRVRVDGTTGRVEILQGAPTS
jgi:phosphoenolpyruvate synthase/pyruvate phosphate dikinase